MDRGCRIPLADGQFRTFGEYDDDLGSREGRQNTEFCLCSIEHLFIEGS